MGRIYRMSNDKWSIEIVRSVMPGHVTGWLINEDSGQRYVFSVHSGKLFYTKQIEPKKGVPKYVDDFILNLQGIGW